MRGVGIISVSSEMEEILSMSDRVLVVLAGVVADEVIRRVVAKRQGTARR